MTQSDPEEGDSFGLSVVMEGNRAIISAPHEDSAGNNNGAFYHFEWNGSSWLETSKIIDPTPPGNNGNLGLAAELEGDIAYITTRSNKYNPACYNTGNIYIFEYSGSAWSQTGVIVPDGCANNMEQAYALSKEGDEFIFGSGGDDSTLTDAGSFKYYKLGGNVAWTSIASGEANDGTYTWTTPTSGSANYSLRVSASDLAGNSAYDISDNTFQIDVPVPEIELTLPNSETTWAAGETKEITWNAADSVSGVAGIEIDYSTGTLVIEELNKYHPNALKASDLFGYSVSIDGNYALVGASGDDDEFLDAGAVYYLKWDGTKWYEIDKLYADDAEE